MEPDFDENDHWVTSGYGYRRPRKEYGVVVSVRLDANDIKNLGAFEQAARDERKAARGYVWDSYQPKQSELVRAALHVAFKHKPVKKAAAAKKKTTTTKRKAKR